MKALTRVFTKKGLLVAIALAAAAAWLMVPATWAQQMEYEADEGFHEEEWYDPSDWFDNDAGIDYETDWYDYTYNYPYDYDYDQDVYGYYQEDFGEEDFGYDYDYYTENWWEDEAVKRSWAN